MPTRPRSPRLSYGRKGSILRTHLQPTAASAYTTRNKWDGKSVCIYRRRSRGVVAFPPPAPSPPKKIGGHSPQRFRAENKASSARSFNKNPGTKHCKERSTTLTDVFEINCGIGAFRAHIFCPPATQELPKKHHEVGSPEKLPTDAFWKVDYGHTRHCEDCKEVCLCQRTTQRAFWKIWQGVCAWLNLINVPRGLDSSPVVSWILAVDAFRRCSRGGFPHDRV